METFDIIIIGFGLSGAVAALEAARSGAHTLVIDSAPHHQAGGNSLVAGQGVFSGTDHDGLVKYFTALRTRVSDQHSWAEHAMAVVPYLLRLGFPLALAKRGGDFVDAPGSEALQRWRPADRHVEPIVRHIQRLAIENGVWLRCNSRAIGLTNTDRSQFDVTYTRRGRLTTVRAQRGVVLATGGHAALGRYASLGTPFSVGDALKLARHVGARVCRAVRHAGPFYGFRVPGTRLAVTPRHLYELPSQDPAPGTGMLVSCIDGKRMSIPPPHLHGLIRTPSAQYAPARLHHALLVVDDEALCIGPLVERWPDGHAEGWARRYGDAWSLTNDVEIGLGWLHGLSRASRRTLKLRGRGEHFALPLEPVVLNTLGGLLCDANYRVLGATAPINGLYGVGEASSVFGQLYQGSGNLTECVLSSRIAIGSALHGKELRSL